MSSTYNYNDTTSIRPYVTREEVATYQNDQLSGIIGLDFENCDIWETKEEAFSNLETYYLAINMWLALADDLSQEKFVRFIKAYIQRKGLIAAIRFATNIADGLRRNTEEAWFTAESLWTTRFGYESDSVSYSVDFIIKRNLTDMLQVFDYLRRFSVENATKLAERCIDEVIRDDRFVEERAPIPMLTGNEIRSMSAQKAYSYSLKHRSARFWERFIYWMKLLLPTDDPFNGHIGEVELSFGGEVATGAASDSCTCLFCKRLHFRQLLWGYRIDGVMPNTLGWHAVRLKCVPKNYKTVRIISPMPVSKQAEGYILLHHMNDHIRKTVIDVPGCGATKLSEIILLDPDNGVDEDGNYLNPAHKRLAEDFDRYATIDSSKASDSVLKTHLYKVKTKFIKALLENAPFSFYVGLKDPKCKKVGPHRFTMIPYGKAEEVHQVMHMAAPMGVVTTFGIERSVFAAITLMAYEYYFLFNPDAKLKRPWIFGDDIGCDTQVAPLVMEFLQLFGFLPNEEKSFLGDIPYRESCGRHFHKFSGEVEECTIMYFPRHPMNRDYCQFDGFRKEWDSRASALVSMNNRLYLERDGRTLRYGYAYSFINKYIREQYPKASFVLPTMPWYREGMLLGSEVLYQVKYLPEDATEPVYEEVNAVEALALATKYPSLRVKTTSLGKRASREAIRRKVSADKPCLHVAYTKAEQGQLMQEFLYSDYLQWGPSFNNKLDETLHVSTRRSSELYSKTPIIDLVTRWS